jgi:hypothetical protein
MAQLDYHEIQFHMDGRVFVPDELFHYQGFEYEVDEPHHARRVREKTASRSKSNLFDSDYAGFHLSYFLQHPTAVPVLRHPIGSLWTRVLSSCASQR